MRSSVDAAAFYKAMTALMDSSGKKLRSKFCSEIKSGIYREIDCTLSATDFGYMAVRDDPRKSATDFAFVFWNSAGIQKVCRYFDGALELELQLSGQRKSQIITMRCGRQGRQVPGL